jgi:hypothetical protein
MSKNFSFRYICQNKISKVRLIGDMPVEQHLELKFDDSGEYIPPCEWVIGTIFYNLPLRSDTIDAELECFNFIEETFGDYLYSELMDKIKEVKNQRTFKRR